MGNQLLVQETGNAQREQRVAPIIGPMCTLLFVMDCRVLGGKLSFLPDYSIPEAVLEAIKK